MADTFGNGSIPVWIKVVYTLYVAILIPIYWSRYGPANFLWFSDIALLVTVAALWLESSLLASMMTVAILLPEAAWTIGFFGRLIFGADMTGLAGYMFDARRKLDVR